MSKVSALSIFNFNSKGSFNSFDWQKKPDNTPSPYYEDENRAHRETLKESELLENNLKTNKEILKHKITNSLIVYPVKGFKGDRNSNFYEYLSMGVFPYITGGLTLIAMFNGITKHLNKFDAKMAKRYGYAAGLGVALYAVAKAVSNKFVSVPVKLKTGIDMDLPCRNVVSLISTTPEEYEAEENRLKALKEAGKPDEKSFEYHKVFESVDYPKFELLYKNKKGENRNENYDIIAEKNGFGKNLPASDQEVKPFIKEVVTKARTAQNISQYLWAAVGVGLGVQDSWEKIFKLGKFKKGDKTYFECTKQISRIIGKTVKRVCSDFYNGGPVGKRKLSNKIAGRTILGLAVLSTVAGTINAMRNPYIENTKKMNNSNVFKTNAKVTED